MGLNRGLAYPFIRSVTNGHSIGNRQWRFVFVNEILEAICVQGSRIGAKRGRRPTRPESPNHQPRNTIPKCPSCPIEFLTTHSASLHKRTRSCVLRCVPSGYDQMGHVTVQNYAAADSAVYLPRTITFVLASRLGISDLSSRLPDNHDLCYIDSRSRSGS
jgi:hypothetical protein